MKINEYPVYPDNRLCNNSDAVKMQAVHEGRVWTYEKSTSTKFIPNFADFEATSPCNIRNICVEVSRGASETRAYEGK
jgi:hypothetical protein